jgi:hypothetical protein
MELAEPVVSGYGRAHDKTERDESGAAGENRAARQGGWHDRAAPYFSSA